jgi:hypothetical protein
MKPLHAMPATSFIISDKMVQESSLTEDDKTASYKSRSILTVIQTVKACHETLRHEAPASELLLKKRIKKLSNKDARSFQAFFHTGTEV